MQSISIKIMDVNTGTNDVTYTSSGSVENETQLLNLNSNACIYAKQTMYIIFGKLLQLCVKCI